MRVLDIGCAEAGILCALCESGATGFGLELSPSRLHLARQFAPEETKPHLYLLAADFFQMPIKDQAAPFSLILLRDVFEHLPDKKQAFAALVALMERDATLLLTFPPFYSPFGGHQQMLRSFLRRMPFFHIAPEPLWRYIKSYIEKHDPNPGFLEEMEKLRNNRMSIGLVKKLARKHGLVIMGQKYYLSRPSYKLRFGWPVISADLLGRIPGVREFSITGAAILLRKK
jgi:SAM-dependent methyltransferase